MFDFMQSAIAPETKYVKVMIPTKFYNEIQINIRLENENLL